MHFLRYIILCDITPIVDELLPHLKATEVSSLLCATGTTDRFRHARKYLNPLRDIDPSMEYFNNMIRDGHTILVLGDGVETIMHRISKPEEYWESRRWTGCEGRDTWILAIPSNAMELIDDADSLLMAYSVGNGPLYAFKDLMARELMKQIWADDDGIGHMGDEEDWSFTWHCSHSCQSVMWHEPLEVTTDIIVPDAIPDYAPCDIRLNGLSFHVGWNNIYFNHLKTKGWGRFPYIHINRDPLNTVYTTIPASPGNIPKLYIALTDESGKEAYVTIF